MRLARRALFLLAVLAFGATAHAQVYPNIPDNTVLGRMGAGQAGPPQAIPFTAITGGLLSDITGDCVVSASAQITCTKTNGALFGTAATANVGVTGGVVGPMPTVSGCLNGILGFNAGGVPACLTIAPGNGNVVGSSPTTVGDFVGWGNTTGTGVGDIPFSQVGAQVANNTALKAASTAAFPAGVWRLTFGNGNGAEPLFYSPSASACTLNAGAGDNGSQVESADGKCWLGQFPGKTVNPLQFGAIGDAHSNATDNTLAFQAAANVYANMFIPQGSYCIKSGPVVFSNAGVDIDGSGNPQDQLDACGHDGNIVELNAGGIKFSNLAIGGFGNSGDINPGYTFTSASAPGSIPLSLTSACGGCLVHNVLVIGGTVPISIQAEVWFTNVTAYQNYGSAIIQDESGLDADYVFADNSGPQCNPTAGQTIANWQASQSYTSGTIVSTNNTGTNYLLIACSSGTSSTVQPGTSGLPFKPYQSAIVDGTVDWYIFSPASSSAILIQQNGGSASGEQHWRRVDMTGPQQVGLTLTGAFSGFQCDDCNVGGIAGNGMNISGTGGSYVMFSKSGVSAEIGHQADAVYLNSPFNTVFQWNGGQLFVYDGYGVVDSVASGASVAVTGATVAASSTGVDGFLASANITKFDFSHNFLSGFTTGMVVSTGSSDYYNILYNLGGGAASDGGTGTNKNVTGNH